MKDADEIRQRPTAPSPKLKPLTDAQAFLAAAVDRFLTAPEFDEIIPRPLEKMTDAECEAVITKVRRHFGEKVSMAKLRSAFLEEQIESDNWVAKERAACKARSAGKELV
ncbi:hypothetical protein LCGC14_0734760 [marine sediment metagenome]|uniref:Uncharacterized protein n=1 Tax=marine sediment metagenome TaxID=412755 RepID=A0A0F9QCQ3_9ZZZZ